jgi:hypothetical protein
MASGEQKHTKQHEAASQTTPGQLGVNDHAAKVAHESRSGGLSADGAC